VALVERNFTFPEDVKEISLLKHVVSGSNLLFDRESAARRRASQDQV
jgi:hypothetical protein